MEVFWLQPERFKGLKIKSSRFKTLVELTPGKMLNDRNCLAKFFLHLSQNGAQRSLLCWEVVDRETVLLAERSDTVQKTRFDHLFLHCSERTEVVFLMSARSHSLQQLSRLRVLEFIPNLGLLMYLCQQFCV
jgi:hypothetical protein